MLFLFFFLSASAFFLVDKVSLGVNASGIQRPDEIEETRRKYCEEGSHFRPGSGDGSFCCEAGLDLGKVLPGDKGEGLKGLVEDQVDITMTHWEADQPTPRGEEGEGRPHFEVVQYEFLAQESLVPLRLRGWFLERHGLVLSDG